MAAQQNHRSPGEEEEEEEEEVVEVEEEQQEEEQEEEVARRLSMRSRIPHHVFSWRRSLAAASTRLTAPLMKAGVVLYADDGPLFIDNERN